MTAPLFAPAELEADAAEPEADAPVFAGPELEPVTLGLPLPLAVLLAAAALSSAMNALVTAAVPYTLLQ